MFAVREFRPIFAAHILSMFGSFFAEVSLAVLVFQRTGSPLLTSLIFALGMLPYALSGVLLSGVADRYPARRVLVTCDLLCAACVAVLALPLTPLALLFVLRAVLAMITPLFQGTRAASLADILEGDVYVLGRSLLRIISQSAQIIGFGIGGLVLVVLSPRAALTVGVGTFLCSAALLRLGTTNRPARITGTGSMMRQSLRGARQLLSHPRIRALLLWWWVPPMFFAVAEGLATPFAAAAGAGSAGVGLMLAAMPAGTVASELAAGTLLSPAARTWIAMPLAGVALVPMALFACHPSLPVAIVIMLVVGLCSAYALGMDKWFVEAVPEEMRGQAMSLLGAGMMTLQGLGMAVGGAIAEVVPPYAVISGAGILGTVSTLLVLRSVAATGRGGAAAAV
ncbi:MFS transporter [Streptomyces sp. H10-C2]|uniref:MFS transporter n=1 Tax=unclassified Streptomyces TaxID=2593676 RepID=UPI0024BB276D|nr:MULTISPECIES: MFS transporter [unclassified Streptomyces]MDJ0341493.1 MFS transporter [Streptomyces sp. PH10-H1]MDJ0369150.1 MFS transporter [Streptomyces sp. H10-C2]